MSPPWNQETQLTSSSHTNKKSYTNIIKVRIFFPTKIKMILMSIKLTTFRTNALKSKDIIQRHRRIWVIYLEFAVLLNIHLPMFFMSVKLITPEIPLFRSRYSFSDLSPCRFFYITRYDCNKIIKFIKCDQPVFIKRIFLWDECIRLISLTKDVWNEECEHQVSLERTAIELEHIITSRRSL